jgi:hypothetical protein
MEAILVLSLSGLELVTGKQALHRPGWRRAMEVSLARPFTECTLKRQFKLRLQFRANLDTRGGICLRKYPNCRGIADE